jgi:hypothetical protein
VARFAPSIKASGAIDKDLDAQCLASKGQVEDLCKWEELDSGQLIDEQLLAYIMNKVGHAPIVFAIQHGLNKLPVQVQVVVNNGIAHADSAL